MRGRGSRKLELALEALPIEIAGRTCIDLGASHGGFVRVLLDAGAAHVFAVDVAYGILDYPLRIDPRVTAIERSNVRNLDPAWFGELPEQIVVTCDVSFMSIRTVLTALKRLLGFGERTMEGLFLLKPQFEDSKSTEKGILKDEGRRSEIIQETEEFCGAQGFGVTGRFDLPVESGKNREVFLRLVYTGPGR